MAPTPCLLPSSNRLLSVLNLSTPEINAKNPSIAPTSFVNHSFCYHYHHHSFLFWIECWIVRSCWMMVPELSSCSWPFDSIRILSIWFHLSFWRCCRLVVCFHPLFVSGYHSLLFACIDLWLNVWWCCSGPFRLRHFHPRVVKAHFYASHFHNTNWSHRKRLAHSYFLEYHVWMSSYVTATTMGAFPTQTYLLVSFFTSAVRLEF